MVRVTFRLVGPRSSAARPFLSRIRRPQKLVGQSPPRILLGRARAGEVVNELDLNITSPMSDRFRASLNRPAPTSNYTAALGHTTYIFSLLAYLVSVRARKCCPPLHANVPHARFRVARAQDMLWLRALALCGSVTGIVFHSLQPVPMRLPIVRGGRAHDTGA